MNKLNNKGQTLVLFVVIVPVIIMIIALVVDIGNIASAKTSLNNINALVLDYALDHLDEDIQPEVTELIGRNDPKIDYIEIKKIDNGYKIIIKKDINGIFSNILKDFYEVSSEYEGQLLEGSKKIKRIK